MTDRAPPPSPDAAAAAPAPPIAWIEPAGVARAAVLVLHGLDMSPAWVAAIVASLRLPALAGVPSGPVARGAALRSWWPVDDVQRDQRLARGASDLHAVDPSGREQARAELHAAARALRARAPGLPLVVAGFSQGAMLALDGVFQDPPLAVDALALWSASRLAFEQWRPALQRLRGVRVELRHGHADANIAIGAAQALRDALVEGGADVRWLPFDGGHEIPLGAWTGLRRLVREIGVSQ
jgi:phospholipase/carboxylesterase